jgi:5-formyltetrahydrofolate cyclo-ligase
MRTSTPTVRSAPVTPPIAGKQELRAQMRQLRRAIPDVDERSARIWAVVQAMPEVRAATTLMAFTSIHGESDTAPLVAWCVGEGIRVLVPEDDPSPHEPDVVIVPGVAFTRDGHRLGQGGGWYDRFLHEVRDRCTTIGVCFHEQVVDALPVEDHDVAMDTVVTDAGRVR